MHFFIKTSGAPFVITLYLFPILWIVVIIFLSESNGISFTLSIVLYNSSLFSPIFSAASTIAFSVASPSTSFLLFILQSVHILPNCKICFLLSPTTSTTCILFCVRVPVLSDAITVLLPNVSTAGNFLIILFFLAILVIPIDSIMVTTVGNPSGIAATASPTDVIKISIAGIFLSKPITNTNEHIISAVMPNLFPTSPNLFWSGVSGDSSLIIIWAILPTFVFIPVSVATASACPLTAMVVANIRFSISPKDTFSFKITSAFLSTGKVSPVSADSSTLKL